MSLYRTYRPLDFSSLEGQDHIREILLGALKSERVSHAYLFTGPRGTGKTSTARIMARAINCLDVRASGPCNECDICRAALEDRLTDMVEIDAASHGLVDDARALVEQARFMPSQAKKKVYIIDEVHMLSKSAFNALLKIIEEPPEHVHFILATTEAHKVLDTIKSRCQRFDFHLADEASLQKQLKMVCEREHVDADDSALQILATHARGSYRDALSLLEQVIGAGSVTVQSIQASLGLSEDSAVEAFVMALLNGEQNDALHLIQEVHDQGNDLSQFCQKILEHFRAMLLKGHQDSEKILRWIDIFFSAYEQLREAFIPLMPLELAVMKCLMNAKALSPSPVIVSDQIVKTASSGVSLKASTLITPVAAPSHDISIEDQTNPHPQEVSVSKEPRVSPQLVTPFDSEKLLSFISSVPLKSLLKHSQIVPSAKGFKVLARYEFELGKIREPANVELLASAYEEMTGSRVSFEFELQPAPSNLPPQSGLSNTDVKSVFL